MHANEREPRGNRISSQTYTHMEEQWGGDVYEDGDKEWPESEEETEGDNAGNEKRRLLEERSYDGGRMRRRKKKETVCCFNRKIRVKDGGEKVGGRGTGGACSHHN